MLASLRTGRRVETGISVVIPTKDRITRLRATISFFLRQEEVREIVVVVDGSRDGTVQYLEASRTSDDRIRYLDNGVNRGTPYSRNAGVDAVRCEYIFMAEDDLEIPEDFFKVLLAHMKCSKADIISARTIYRTDEESADEALRRADRVHGEPVNRRTLEANWSTLGDTDIEQPMLPGPMLARTEVFRAIRFDERYKVNFWREETDFQLSALASGHKLVFCPHVVIFNVVTKNDRGGSHGVGQMRRVRWLIINNWRFLRKHRATIESNFQIGNPYGYIVKFAVKSFTFGVMLPFVIRAKRRLLD